MRRVIALWLSIAALPATAFGQVSFQRPQSTDRPRPPVTVIVEPGSSASLPLHPPIGYPRIPGTVILPHPPLMRPMFAPPPPRPPRPISLRARVVTGAAVGFVVGAVFGVPVTSQTCDAGPRATGPCRAGSAGLGLVLGGAVGAFSWLGRQ